MENYKVLDNQIFKNNGYTLMPIRYEDRWNIMKWRNEQIYHLRQSKPLNKKDQENYFKETIMKLFEQDFPSQILFSLLKDKICIGYGGLVHINWKDSNAELSFIMDTNLEKNKFHIIWSNFLVLIERVIFNDLKLHKIYTYAFDLRPQIYEVLEQNGFTREATLKEHCHIDKKYIDVILHSKFNEKRY